LDTSKTHPPTEGGRAYPLKERVRREAAAASTIHTTAPATGLIPWAGRRSGSRGPSSTAHRAWAFCGPETRTITPAAWLRTGSVRVMRDIPRWGTGYATTSRRAPLGPPGGPHRAPGDPASHRRGGEARVEGPASAAPRERDRALAAVGDRADTPAGEPLRGGGGGLGEVRQDDQFGSRAWCGG